MERRERLYVMVSQSILESSGLNLSRRTTVSRMRPHWQSIHRQVLLSTGDFKVDYTPVFGDAIDLQRFAEIGKKGVLALMSDSTNAERKGFTQSERTVGITFDHILQSIRIQD